MVASWKEWFVSAFLWKDSFVSSQEKIVCDVNPGKVSIRKRETRFT
jgi:hypothetical protein